VVAVRHNTPQSDAVWSSDGIPGPFLVAAVELESTLTFPVSFEVTVTPVPVRRVPPPAFTQEPSGDRFMAHGPGQAEVDMVVIGEVRGVDDAALHWPWWVYEGAVGYVTLWVRDRSVAVLTKDVRALVSVWGLRAVA